MLVAMINQNPSADLMTRILLDESLAEAIVRVNANDAISLPERGSIDMLVLGAMTPEQLDKDLQSLRLNFDFIQTPVLVCGPRDIQSIVTAFSYGAADYIDEGASRYEITARIRKARSNRAMHLSQIQQHLGLLERFSGMQQVNELLRQESLTDPVTGLSNRRFFDLVLKQQWSDCARNSLPISLIMIDIDFFKRYNDTYGHLAGDDALRKVARGLQSAVQRPLDLVSRYGGEEFAIILPHTNPRGAEIVAQNIQEVIRDLHITHEDSEVAPHLTVSQGISTFVPTPRLEAKNIIKSADQSLYAAKASGRDQFVWSNALSENATTAS